MFASAKGFWAIEREHSFPGQGDGWHEAKSYSLHCPRCGSRWADVIFAGETLVWPVAQTCESCQVEDEWMPVPGSLLVEEGYGVIDTALLAALPEELVRREFQLHLKAYGYDTGKTETQAKGSSAQADQRGQGDLQHPAG